MTKKDMSRTRTANNLFKDRSESSWLVIKKMQYIRKNLSNAKKQQHQKKTQKQTKATLTTRYQILIVKIERGVFSLCHFMKNME